MNLGNDELSRPVTDDAIRNARTLQSKLQLLASMPGPLQSHLSDCVRMSGTADETRSILAKQITDLRSSLVPILLPEIRDALREEYLLCKDLPSEMLDIMLDSRSVRSVISEVANDALDLGDFKDDIKSDIERDLDDKIDEAINDFDFADKINEAINHFDFSDILDDHVSTVGVRKRLVDEINDDHNHPLVSAILNALVLRIGRA